MRHAGAELIAIELFEVPPGGDDEFVAVWRAEGGGTLYRALRDDVAFRYASVGPGGGYEVVEEGGDPDAATGATLIAPYEVEPADDERFVEAWRATQSQLAGQRGFIGGRLHRGEGERFRFVDVTGWSSPLMVQRATRRPEYEPPPFAAHPALYVVTASASDG